jgi:hypothetical protein
MQTMTWVITWREENKILNSHLLSAWLLPNSIRLFLVYEEFSIFVGARFYDAYKVAFEQYAPRTRASKRSVGEEPWFRGADNSGQAKGQSKEEAL